jgi:hypothetical protein
MIQGTEWQFGTSTAEARRFAAVYGGEKKTCLDYTLYGLATNAPVYSPLSFMGNFVGGVMNGVELVSVYRYNYIYLNGWDEVVRRSFHISSALEKWGVFQSRTPADTCLLISRGGEDWWQVKSQAMLDDKDLGIKKSVIADRPELIENFQKESSSRLRKLQLERFRGMVSNKCFESILLEKGLPYEVEYADLNPVGLEKYKLIVIPFGYSISKETAESLKVALGKGSKILIFDMLGEVDQYGKQYTEPLLNPLIANPNVIYLKDVLFKDGSMRSTKEICWSKIRSLLGTIPYYFNPNGCNVEYLPREISGREKIMMLANWEKEKTADVILGLDMPAGNYNVEICDQTCSFYKAKINGRRGITEADLKKFKISLEPESLWIIRIVPEVSILSKK